MRLIDTDKLLEGEHFILKCKSEFGVVEMDVFRREVIDNAPTVDTTCPNCDSGYAQGYSDGYLKGKEERPQGEWRHNSDHPDNLICSVCNCEWDMWRYESKELKFCPNCGADMRGEDNEDSN